jgi:hypothetical protein
VFLEVLEEAAKHHDAFDRWCDMDDDEGSELQTEESPVEDDQGCDEAKADDVGKTDVEPARDGAPADAGCSQSTSTRVLDLYLA